MDWQRSLIRLGLSLLLSFPIGWNREQAHKSAGLRTHLLVSLGSCLFTLIGLDMARLFGGDSGRIAAQVVTGIGFLGGGAILRERFSVRGITTAAAIWSTAAVGMACGAGFYPGAVAGAGATFLILGIVERWEEKERRRARRTIDLTIRVLGSDGMHRVRESIQGFGIGGEHLRLEAESEGGASVLRIREDLAEDTASRLVAHLLQDPDVVGIESKLR